MNTKFILFIFILPLLFSCKGNKIKDNGHNEHKGHEYEGKVFLTPEQCDALQLQTGPFEMRNLTTVIKTNGQLEVPPASSAEVTAIIGGNVKKINVFHGDRVNKGQVLAVLEHPDFIDIQEDFAEISNSLEFLENEYNRQKELFENKVGSGKDFQQVKSEYSTAKAKYEGLKSRLQLLDLSPDQVKNGIIVNTINITSPIKGFVNQVNIKVGTYAGARDKLFKITDNSEIHADFLVYEKDISLLKQGQKIHFTISSRPGEELLATIFAIGKEFEDNTKAVHIHASLDNKQDNLIPGMYISGHIHTDKTYTRALPNDAIVKEGTKSYIFIAEAPEETHPDTGNDHGQEESISEPERHDEKTEHEKGLLAFKMVEVITGKQDEGYTEIRLMEPLPKGINIVRNAAYYLHADMKKEETEHHH
jgi:membrane fusion protein, heavy metal efflux system